MPAIDRSLSLSLSLSDCRYDLSLVGYTGKEVLAKNIDLAAFCACRAYAGACLIYK